MINEETTRPEDDEIELTKTDETTTPTKPKIEKPVGPKLVVTNKELDEEEQEFRAMREDLPGVAGASAVGIVAISVAKIPGKNQFFRTHPDFRPIIPIVDVEVGMEKAYFAIKGGIKEALASIGITVTPHTLYLTVTSTGAVRLVPIRHANADGVQNEYTRTKEIGLRDGIKKWVRIYTDQENKCYRVYPAPKQEQYGEPVWPELSPAKVFRLAFRDKGRLIDSTEHPLFLKWAARDPE